MEEFFKCGLVSPSSSCIFLMNIDTIKKYNISYYNNDNNVPVFIHAYKLGFINNILSFDKYHDYIYKLSLMYKIK